MIIKQVTSKYISFNICWPMNIWLSYVKTENILSKYFPGIISNMYSKYIPIFYLIYTQTKNK